jgi:trehalose-6-phosphate synthase
VNVNFSLFIGREVVWIGHRYAGLTRRGSNENDLSLRLSGDKEVRPLRASCGSSSETLTIIPVKLSDAVATSHFRGFCKGVLWPLFHYYGGVKSYSQEAWQGYCEANREFAKTIIEHYQEGDLIFIQDYHLMVLPELLRQQLPNAKIGFFLHTPWPRFVICC